MDRSLCLWTEQCNEDSAISRSRAQADRRCRNQARCCHSLRRAATQLDLRASERLRQDLWECFSGSTRQRSRRESYFQGDSDRPVERSQNRQAIICDSIRPRCGNQDAQRRKSPAAKSRARNERRFLPSECICLVRLISFRLYDQSYGLLFERFDAEWLLVASLCFE